MIVVDVGQLLLELEEALKQRGVHIMKGRFGGKGGLGRYRDRWILAIDRSLPDSAKLDLLAEALAQFNVAQGALSDEAYALVVAKREAMVKEQHPISIARDNNVTHNPTE